MFKSYGYMGFLIGITITCVMGALYFLIVLINDNYEGGELILWLTFLIGLPSTLLLVPLDSIIIMLGLKIADIFVVLFLCFLNWTFIGNMMSMILKRNTPSERRE